MATAATLLLAVGIGHVINRSQNSSARQHQLADGLGRYLDAFSRNPTGAQRILQESYVNWRVSPEEAARHVKYAPKVGEQIPDGYTLEAMFVFNMPCCTCVQAICRRADGSRVALFEHDPEETAWFADFATITAICQGKPTCIAERNGLLAASWDVGERRLTAVGVQDLNEISRLAKFLHSTI